MIKEICKVVHYVYCYAFVNLFLSDWLAPVKSFEKFLVRNFAIDAALNVEIEGNILINFTYKIDFYTLIDLWLQESCWGDRN